MSFRRKTLRRSLWKVMNLCTAVVIVLGLFLPGTTQAAKAAASAVCDNTTGQNTIFLPLVTKLTQSLAAGFQNVQGDPQAVDRKLKYTVGKTYVYNYNVEVVTKSSTRTSASTDVTTNDQSKTVMAAQAEVSITGQEADGTFAGQIVMKVPYVCSADLKTGTASVGDTTDLATELLKPLLFKQKPNGVITSVSYPANGRPTAINMQKGVINALQTMLQDGADTYKAPEVGGQGTYTATYKLQEQGSLLNIAKSYDQDSYSKLNQQGDTIKSLKLNSALSSVLDGDKGVISSVASTETLITGDGAAQPDEPANAKFDGTTTWSTVDSNGQLVLKEVKASENLQAAALTEAYVDGGLEPIQVAPEANPHGIDLSKVNLVDEFADFEKAPTDPAKFSRILDLVAADTTEIVVDKIIERLNANAGNETIARVYVDLLSVIATPKAQTALASLLKPGVAASGISATMSITTQNQALIDLVRIQSPITTTVDTVAQLSGDNTNPLNKTAISVLGATINNLSDENPNKANALADGLVRSLNDASQDNKEIYLDALGNAGVPATLDEIKAYTEFTPTTIVSGTNVVTEAVQASAYYALRKIPGQEAESLLVAALTDESQPRGTRLLVMDVLKNRPNLSESGAAALNAALAAGGTYYNSWGSWLGNSTLGIHFPGSFTVSSNSGLYLYADQQANGYVWGRNFQVARGQLVSYRYNPNPSYQFIGAYLDVAGNRIVQSERYILCNYGYTGNLWANNWHWSFRVSIPIVWVITIDVDVRVTVNVAIDYAYSLNVCTPTNASMSATLTPRAWAGVVAEASLNLRLARGGIGINVTIMNTALPSRFTLSFNGSSFGFCVDVRVTTQPLSGYIYAFADVGIDYWLGAYWKRIYQGNLATFNVGTYSYPVFVRCF